MRQLYEKLECLLQLVPFEDISPGFGRCDFAIYNSAHVFLADCVIPWDNRFVGNTALEFEGDYIAIYQVENPRETDIELLAANLVHEMFHVYQMRSGQNRWPDDFLLLAYPDDIENYRLKYAENQLLAAAYHETGQRKNQLLAAFCGIRRQRAKQVGEYFEQELLAEQLEGGAEYAGCRALESINPDKFHAKLAHYLDTLQTVDKIFFDIRRLSYFTGAVYRLTRADCAKEDSLQTELFEYRQLKSGQIRAFMEQNPVEIREDCMICGYDPMNMIICGRQVLCTHFVRLQSGENTRYLKGPVLLELKEGKNRVAGKYWILPQEKP